MSDDPIDAPFANGETGLSQLLGNHLGGSFGVEKAVADGLTDQFLAAAVRGFRASLVTEQGWGAPFEEEVAQLKVALAAEAELGSSLIGSQGTTFPFNEHGQFPTDFILGGDG